MSYSREFVNAKVDIDGEVALLKDAITPEGTSVKILPEKRLGQMDVLTILVSHTQDSWKKNAGVILEFISQYPKISLEYFPPEWSALEIHPLWRWFLEYYKSNNDLYYKVLPALEQKEILALDPAYSKVFILARAQRVAPVVGPALAFNLVAAALFSKTRFGRRGAIIFGLGGTISTAVAVDKNDPTYWEEDDLRDVIKAEFWATLVKNGHRGKILDLDNEHHFLIRSYYLEHEEERRQVLADYKEKYGFPIFKPLFVARKYNKKGSIWVREDLVRI